MSNFNYICLLCLEEENDLKLVESKDTDDIGNKLKYSLPEYAIASDIPEYICVKCERTLNNFYEVKRKWLQNMTAYKKYAQQITTKHDSYEFSTVELANDSRNDKVEISDDHNYDKCYSEFQTETNIEIVNSIEFKIEEELDELVLDDELASLLHEIKQENPESDVTCNKNKIISGENVRTPENGNNTEQNEAGQYECYICHTTYLNKEKLESHIEIHNTYKSFTCEFCKKSFQRLETLKTHLFLHTDEKLFTCEICNKSFRLLGTLTRHKLLHTGEKPFTCEICNKSFRQLGTLKRHKLLHTGEKLFTCEFCNKSFRQLSNLKQHKLLHIGEKLFSCDSCSKSFRHWTSLQKHKLVHTGEKSFGLFSNI